MTADSRSRVPVVPATASVAGMVGGTTVGGAARSCDATDELETRTGGRCGTGERRAAAFGIAAAALRRVATLSPGLLAAAETAAAEGTGLPTLKPYDRMSIAHPASAPARTSAASNDRMTGRHPLHTVLSGANADRASARDGFGVRSCPAVSHPSNRAGSKSMPHSRWSGDKRCKPAARLRHRSLPASWPFEAAQPSSGAPFLSVTRTSRRTPARPFLWGRVSPVVGALVGPASPPLWRRRLAGRGV